MDDTSGDGTGTAPTDTQADDGPALPSTGMDVGGLALLGLMTLALGAYLRRRTSPRRPARPGASAGSRLRGNLAPREHPQDPRRGGQARPRWPRPRGQDHRPRAARRGHGGDLHGPAPDARADRRDRAAGGRRRGRPVDPVGRAHDARAADRRRCSGERGRRGRGAGGRRARSPTTTSPSSSSWACPRCSRPAPRCRGSSTTSSSRCRARRRGGAPAARPARPRARRSYRGLAKRGHQLVAELRPPTRARSPRRRGAP